MTFTIATGALTLEMVNAVFIAYSVKAEVDIERSKWKIKIFESHHAESDNEHEQYALGLELTFVYINCLFHVISVLSYLWIVGWLDYLEM